MHSFRTFALDNFERDSKQIVDVISKLTKRVTKSSVETLKVDYVAT